MTKAGTLGSMFTDTETHSSGVNQMHFICRVFSDTTWVCFVSMNTEPSIPVYIETYTVTGIIARDVMISTGRINLWWAKFIFRKHRIYLDFLFFLNTEVVQNLLHVRPLQILRNW